MTVYYGISTPVEASKGMDMSSYSRIRLFHERVEEVIDFGG
jgi:hypothetical protein